MSAADYLLPNDIDDREQFAIGGSTKVVNLFVASNIARRQPTVRELMGRVREFEQEVSELDGEVRRGHDLLRLVQAESIRKIRIISLCYSSALLFVLVLWSISRWVR